MTAIRTAADDAFDGWEFTVPASALALLLAVPAGAGDRTTVLDESRIEHPRGGVQALKGDSQSSQFAVMTDGSML